MPTSLLPTNGARLPLRVAVDLDGVLTEHPAPLARAASARFGLDLPERAFIDSAGLNVPLEVRDWVYSDDGPAAHLRPCGNGVTFLDGLIGRLGADHVLIVTARPEASKAMTEAWLERHGFARCGVAYADDKAAVALTHGCAVAIEDSLRHARNYAAVGVTCFLLPCGDRAVDDLTETIPGVIRVSRLEQILDHLDDEHAVDEPVGDASGEVLGGTERPTVVISDAIHPVARARFARHATVVDVDGTDRAALLVAVAGADALVVRSETDVDAEVLHAGPRLRVVARAGAGVDNVDLGAATRSGVLVLNAPGANRFSAGEHTIALLLAITRQIPGANASTHAGKWERKKQRPIDLRGRTVGIVGLGRVGAVVAQRLRAFEMTVIAHDPYLAPARFAELGVDPVSYESLLARSDVVTFHVPANDETRHMLDAAAIARLKPEAIVLNVARGEVVDQAALAEALQSGRVLGAGVDVFPEEPCTASPLFGLPNAVVTPHIGGSSIEALAAVGEVISTSTLAALRGEAVANAVNLPAATVDAPELRRLTTVAGAAGHLLAVLQPERPAFFEVSVRGQVPADVVEHVTAAALSDALQRWTARRVTPVNARLVAEDAGLLVRATQRDTEATVLPSFSFEVRGGGHGHDQAPHHVTVSWDRASAGIVEVDRFSLERDLAGDVLITHHTDQPGVIGRLGTILGNHGVNIAGMQVGRHQRGGEALMVTNVDDEIPEAALVEIKAIPGVGTAYVVSLPQAEGRGNHAAQLALLGT
ncbi:MAG: D-3-phosphoglycerate dehydrogenase [uncultured Thermomicrobiales bacterium]|uniref:D-3-phosphoglycerate dehydrogenase n=1 Tax=uncultured Thermomicrobiales bacterium TaxID=1645740 RepID=A0A6J4TBX8_9BACT|nr:MAG: D-3-phosphoglycerate dehydrogenase [uncultured Thermomicrobiales bacterium]